jgi:hypothetical protein
MKTKAILYGLMLMAASTYSQEKAIKQKSTLLFDGSKLTYNVLASNKQIKQGELFIEQGNDNVLLKGSYNDDQRSGKWSFFNKNYKLYLSYNYDLKKVTYFDINTVIDVNVQVFTPDSTEAKEASMPLPLYSIDGYRALMLNLAQASIFTQRDALIKDLPIKISAHIDKDGNAKYVAIYNLSGKEIKTELKLPETTFKLEWLPSKYQGKKFDSEFVISDVLHPNDSGYRRFYWN